MMNGLAWAMHISWDFIIAIGRYFSSYYIAGVNFYPSQDCGRRGQLGAVVGGLLWNRCGCILLLARTSPGRRGRCLVASLIMVVAVPELDHSQEVRMYTMASALTLASFIFCAMIDSGRFGLLALHLLLTLLAVLTTPTVIVGLLLVGVTGRSC